MRPQQLHTLALAILTAVLLAPLGNYALPTGISLIPRGGYQGVASLIVAVIDFLKDRNAYDSDVPSKCNIFMSTFEGADCQVNIQCPDDGTNGKGTNMPPWNVCYLNGRQYFNHPKLGDFSITYTKAGGVEGNNEDGLHDPVIQLANLNNWEPINVQQIIDQQGDMDAGKLCKKASPAGLKTIEYTCGLPEIGTAGFGMSNFPPASPDPGFTPGWCTMHVVQYQRNEFGIGPDYEFDVIVYDAVKKEIGAVQLAAIDATTKALSVDSQLPYTLDIIAAGGDADPVVFKYADQTWQSGDGSHQSTFGNGPDNGYENGNREGDMGFNC